MLNELSKFHILVGNIVCGLMIVPINTVLLIILILAPLKGQILSILFFCFLNALYLTRLTCFSTRTTIQYCYPNINLSFA